jgi:hypothetical protein
LDFGMLADVGRQFPNVQHHVGWSPKSMGFVSGHTFWPYKPKSSQRRQEIRATLGSTAYCPGMSKVMVFIKLVLMDSDQTILVSKREVNKINKLCLGRNCISNWHRTHL